MRICELIHANRAIQRSIRILLPWAQKSYRPPVLGSGVKVPVASFLSSGGAVLQNPVSKCLTHFCAPFLKQQVSFLGVIFGPEQKKTFLANPPPPSRPLGPHPFLKNQPPPPPGASDPPPSPPPTRKHVCIYIYIYSIRPVCSRQQTGLMATCHRNLKNIRSIR